MMNPFVAIRTLKARFVERRTSRRLALAEFEIVRALQILAIQQEQTAITINEIVDAVNSLGAVVGLEWKEQDKNAKKWLRLQ